MSFLSYKNDLLWYKTFLYHKIFTWWCKLSWWIGSCGWILIGSQNMIGKWLFNTMAGIPKVVMNFFLCWTHLLIPSAGLAVSPSANLIPSLFPSYTLVPISSSCMQLYSSVTIFYFIIRIFFSNEIWSCCFSAYLEWLSVTYTGKSKL